MTLPTSPPITHIVLFKYRTTTPWSDLQSHFDAFLSLQTRCVKPPFPGPGAGNSTKPQPYMRSMRMGKNNSWEPFSKGMTHGFVLEFDSQDDLDYYLMVDPVHAEFSRLARPLIEDSLVVDIRDGYLFGPSPKKPNLNGGVYDGSCHCGDIRWTARLEKAEHILCHCDTCKKLGGGPYSLNQIIGKDELVISEGKPNIYTYRGASGKSVRCYFCSRCTSHIYHHQEIMGDQIIVRTILLEGGKDMAPAAEIFGDGRLGWVKDLVKDLEENLKE